jgi:hypothetical protein
MRVRMVASVIVCTVLALWASAGALTILDEPNAPRLGLLPSPIWLPVVIVVVLLIWFLLRVFARPARIRMHALWLTTVAILPWLPFPVPASFLVWAGPLKLLPWIGLAVALAIPLLRSVTPRALRAAVMNPRLAPRFAALTAVALYLAGAWTISPQLPAADEPHYLVIVQSILLDHDLKIENNHLRGDYRAYYPGRLRPDYLWRGADREIYSVHSPGLPVIVAPAFAAFGYPGVMALLAVFSACAGALLWRAVWIVSEDAAASWFAWAGVMLSVPFFFQAFVVFPDGLGGALTLVGIFPLVSAKQASRRSLVASSVAIALLPWLHTRLALIAALLTLLVALRHVATKDAVTRLALFLALPLVSAVLWLVFFYRIYGTPDPRVQYGWATGTSIGNLSRGIAGLLVDQQFGLLPNAPVYLFAGFGILPLFRRNRRLAMEILGLVVPYGCAVAAYQMWWGGFSSPARFLVPVLLPLAIAMGTWFAAATGRVSRIFGASALTLSLLLTATLVAVERGALLYNVRDGASKFWLWASPLVNVTTALPSVFQSRPPVVAAHAAIWGLAVLATWIVGRLFERRSTVPAAVFAACGLAAIVTAMSAATVVWAFNGTPALTPLPASRLLLKQYRPSGHQLVIRYAPLRRLPLQAAVDEASLPVVTTGRDAARVRQYEQATVIWVDGSAYLERPGVWVAGKADATFIVEPHAQGPIQLFVRNPPVPNRIAVEADEWRVDLTMTPGEERLVDIPAHPERRRTWLRVTSTAGARPTEFERGSQDARLLGCWIEIRRPRQDGSNLSAPGPRDRPRGFRG